MPSPVEEDATYSHRRDFLPHVAATAHHVTDVPCRCLYDTHSSSVGRVEGGMLAFFCKATEGCFQCEEWLLYMVRTL